MALPTDGRALMHDESGNSNIFVLVVIGVTRLQMQAAIHATGTWTQVASLPSTYGPLYFGSAVLPDGRYIIEGGEYNNGNDAWTKLGAIYDPVANTWTSVTPPTGWNSIGDSPSVILTNGTYMQSSCCDTQKQAALLNPSTLAWTSTGAGKFDIYDEEGMTLLPGGNLLDVDAYVFQYNSAGKNWEFRGGVPLHGAPGPAQGQHAEQCFDRAATCGGSGRATHELGPRCVDTTWHGVPGRAPRSCGAG